MSDLNDINIEALDRKEALQYVKRFQVLMEINANINSTIDLEILLRTIIDVAASAMDAEASSLALREVNTGELVFHLASGDSGKTVESVRLPRGQGIAGWVAENNQPLIVPDVSKDQRFFKGVDEKSEFVTRSIMCVPMTRSGNNTIGIVQVLNKKNGTFDNQDLMLFCSLANIAAIAVENSQLYQVLQQTLAKLKEDNTRLNNILGQLKQSEEEVKRMKSQMDTKDGAVTGSLSVFIPPNILQMLGNDMKTGALLFKTPEFQGKLYLEKGEVYHAEFLEEPKLVGNDAVYEMINWNEGSFSFSDTDSHSERSIQGSVMHLIIEGMRRGDELKVLLEKYPADQKMLIKRVKMAEEATADDHQVMENLNTDLSLKDNWKQTVLDQHSFYSSIEKLALAGNIALA